ncbi:MAG: shikimate kinase [Pseudomonadota bacterium]
MAEAHENEDGPERSAQPGGAVPSRGWRLARSVVLVGLMGAGKTSVGHRLASRLQAPFVDSDAEIETAAGMSIPDIFRLHGEPAFRDGERKVIARLIGEGPQVLATGGGAFMDPETRALIDSSAISVWLKADLDTLVARTAGRSHRPLLATGDPRAILADLIETRYPVYAEARLAVESRAGQAHEAMVERIVQALESVPGTLEAV